MKQIFLAVGIPSLFISSAMLCMGQPSIPKADPEGSTSTVSQTLASKPFWRNIMRPVLPKNWIVTAVQSVSAPNGWTRTHGGNGILICCKNPKVTIREYIGIINLSHHPSFTLAIMPQQWEGHSSREAGEDLQGGKYRLKKFDQGQVSVMQDYPDLYLGHSQLNGTPVGHYFGSITGNAGWNKPNECIARKFKLVIDKSHNNET